MGLFDFFKKKPQPVKSTILPMSKSEPQKLSYTDKERIMVRRVTLDDMRKITSVPYLWNAAIQKLDEPHGHPFAYMNLIGPNVDIARQELEKMNVLISRASKSSPTITKRISIPVNKIVFTPPKEWLGYSRLICTPHTFTGEPAQYPVTLSFMTDLSNDTISTHGNLFYGQDGAIQKAEVFCWRTSGSHFYYFNTVDGNLVLEKFECNGEIVYKAPHILAREAMRLREDQDYAWLQANLPDKCPKSLSGYRRMKSQNTKNFQILRQLAADLGREI